MSESEPLRLRKFTVSLGRDDALNTVSVWQNHPNMRKPLSRSNVFDSVDEARARLADLIEQANADGICEPGHECGRCVNWPPQVWDVEISAKPID